jgi:competence protein ComEC
VRGSLQRPSHQRNPGGFDYAAYLARRGICCTMYVGTPAEVTVLGARRGLITSAVVAVRQHIRRALARYVPSADGRAVLRALLLGDRSRISDAQEAHFARTGLMHLLAVSGLHVFLVGMVLYVLLRPFLMRLRLRWRTVEITRAVLTVLALGGYMLLTGARPSVVRAVVMAAFVIGGVLLQRSPRSLNTLGIAALVLMAARPPALFDVGFQLSMAAVGGIVTLNPRFLEWIPEAYRSTAPTEWMWSTVTTSAAAILATAPLLFYHFGWVSAAGLLLNIVGIPCTGLALSAAIAAVTVAPIWPMGAGAFGSAADLFVRGLLETTALGAIWLGWAGLRMPTPNIWILGALTAGVLCIAQWARPRLRWRSLAMGLLFAVGAIWTPVLIRPGPTMDVIFFDVGQGDAVLVTGPDDHRLLVDTGPGSPSGSAAAYTVLPYLRQRGVEHLETVVITHPDGDHLGGLPAILQEMSVGRVVHSGQEAETDLYRESRQLLEKTDTPSRAAERGDQFRVGPSITARVLGPPQHPDRWGIESENGSSVVVHLTYGTTQILLPGDAEGRAEQSLVQTYGGQLASDVVKVPHHGSKTSSTDAFVKTATEGEKQTRAVVSVGEDNRYGMPDSTVLNRWRLHADTVHSTAETGAVWVRSDGQEINAVEWQQ